MGRGGYNIPSSNPPTPPSSGYRFMLQGRGGYNGPQDEADE
jgi:hypothetical protein